MESKEVKKANEEKVKKPNQKYLGEGVFATFDGEGFILNSDDLIDPSDQIYIEESVYVNFVKFADRMFKKMEEEHDTTR